MASSDVSKKSLAHMHSLADLQALGGINSIAKALGTNLNNGLNDEQVVANRESYGSNTLPERPSRAFWDHLVEAFEDSTLRILVGSAVVSMIFGVFVSDSKADFIQGLAIVAAVVIVSGVNSFQNWSKDREFKALGKLKEDFRVLVVRNGKLLDATSSQVVVGDVVKFGPGDKLPVDGLFVQGFGVEVDQSGMTGEAQAVSKDPDSDPFMLAGTMVQQGEGTMIATGIGLDSKMGQALHMVEAEEVEDTPLQVRLEALAETIGKFGTIAGALTVLVLSVMWFMNPVAAGEVRQYTDLVRFFIVGVTIVVVAVPEGLPLAVTISLAFSMRRMMRNNILVRELQACETMGSATVIATDKTGTLTENRMQVVSAWCYDTHIPEQSIPTLGSEPPAGNPHGPAPLANNPGALTRLARSVSLNSTAGLDVTESHIGLVGNPTEAAILKLLYTSLGHDYSSEREKARPGLIARRPFDKATKYMSSLYAAAADRPSNAPPAASSATANQVSTKAESAVLYVKGAPEMVIDMCSYIQQPNSTLTQISAEKRYDLASQVEAMAKKGLRTLAVAYRRVTPEVITSVSNGKLTGKESAKDKATKDSYSNLLLSAPAYGSVPAGEGYVSPPGANHTNAAFAAPQGLESNLVLVGLFGIADPLRDGVSSALAQCMKAGIRVIMVTGDHRDTASHIAEQCGILRLGLGHLVLEGPKFREMSDEERLAVLPHLAVLARSSPTDKHLLVKSLQATGEIVAVTGDGTNDAPALRAADIGLAMGIAGTEVAKEASDIIITDDNFASIVNSVRWGRSIKENIRKFLTFQLTINMVALLLTLATAFTNGGSTDKFPLTPVQLLWVNLIMDSFAALALATEPPTEQLMHYPPQGKEERLITPTMWKNMLGHAVFQFALLSWLTFLPSGPAFFGFNPASPIEGLGSVHHYTAVFTTFVALQIFNLFNCRATHDEWNVLQDFSSSVIGQGIITIIVVMQVIMVSFGGDFTQTRPLTLHQWGLCVLLGFSSLPLGYLLKLLPLCEKQLRRVAPGPSLSARTPSASLGLFYGEKQAVRDQLLKTITHATVVEPDVDEGSVGGGDDDEDGPSSGSSSAENGPSSRTRANRRAGSKGASGGGLGSGAGARSELRLKTAKLVASMTHAADALNTAELTAAAEDDDDDSGGGKKGGARRHGLHSLDSSEAAVANTAAILRQRTKRGVGGADSGASEDGLRRKSVTEEEAESLQGLAAAGASGSASASARNLRARPSRSPHAGGK